MAKKHRGHEEHEEHVNHERWLVSYADMVTLLMCLFIVMFAISNVDAAKFAALKEGLQEGFSDSGAVPLSGRTGLLMSDGAVADPMNIVVPGPVVDTELAERVEAARKASERAEAEQRQLAAEAEVTDLQEVEQAIVRALADRGLADRARFRITEEGLVVVLVADDVFFESASAELRPVGQAVLDAVAPALAPLANAVDVQGHANHLPVSTPVYPSNWELSGARAATVVRFLIRNHTLQETRLTASGYGSSRPLVPTSDPASISTNRRVDLVVRSDEAADVRSLLPTVAAARGHE